MSDRAPVLVLGNDLSPAATEASRDICLALTGLGLRAVGRDTRLIRWAVTEITNESEGRREAYETGVVAKWNKFIFDYGFDTVIGLDLSWLLSAQLFLNDAQVKQIHSFWLDDIRTHFKNVTAFPLAPYTLLEIINNPKVSHHCTLGGQEEDLRQLGVERVFTSMDAENVSGNKDPWENRLRRALA